MNLVGQIMVFLIILLISFYGFKKLATTRRFQVFGEMLTKIDTNEKVVALTYDDGPNPPYTNDLVNILDRQQVKATFFVVGKNVEQYPDVVKDMLSKGHELGNHSYSHLPMIFKTPSFIKSEIEKTDKLLRQLGVKQDIHFRSPFGLKRFILPFMLAKMGRKNILWNITAHDYAATYPEQIENSILNQIQPGSIILLHDGGADRLNSPSVTLKATESVIEKLKEKGYQFKTVSELLMMQA